MLCFLFLKVFYVYLSKIYTETAEISKKKTEFCAWASHFIMNYKITVKYIRISSCNNLYYYKNQGCVCVMFMQAHLPIDGSASYFAQS